MAEAQYGMNFKVVSRGKGSNAVKVASYQSGERLRDDQTGKVFDHRELHLTTKSRVIESAILLPEGCGEWARERGALWNEVEQTHTAKNSQLARWARVTIPREVPAEERMEMVKNFVQREFVDRGMIADISLQENVASDGLPNPHAHIMLTMRPVTDDGLSLPKRAGAGRPWNDLFTRGVKSHDNDNKLGFSNTEGEGKGFIRNTDGLRNFRELWASHVNDALESAGSDARCSDKSLKEQGIDREPQPYIGRAKYGQHKTRENSPALAAVKAVKMQNRLARASRYNRSGDALAEAEQIRRAEAAREKNRHQGGGGRSWSLADEWEINHER